MNGELVAYEDAKVHVLTHALHYGTSVFEGVRAYETPDGGTAVFRHQDHIDRLFRSAAMYHMEIPYSKDEIRSATFETITRNGLKSCYIRPLVFRGAGPMGLYPLDCPVEVMIAVWEWGSYLGEEGKRTGVRAKVSSWRRIPSDSLIPTAKAGGQYLNSVLAKIEADKAGYEEAILLDGRGYVCEGTGENLFIVKDGRVTTPGFANDILEGINRARGDPDPAGPGLRARGARHRPRRALPRRRDLHDRHGGRADADPRGRRPPGRRRHPRPDHHGDPGDLRGRAARALGALRRLAGPGAGADGSAVVAWPRGAVIVYDTTLRDGMQGEGMSLSVEEKVRVARILDELGVPMIEAGFPTSNPKELELFERLREAGLRADVCAFGMTRRRGVAAEEDAALRVLAESWTPVSTLVGKTWGLHLEKVVARRPRGEPADDRTSRWRSWWPPASAWSTTPSTSSTATATTRRTRSSACRPRWRRARRTLTMCDTNGASLPHEIAEAVHVVRRALPNAALGIHTHNDAECAVANSLAGGRRGRHAGPGHDERLRRALRQREPHLDHPEPAAQDGLRVPAVAGGADRGVAPGRRDAQPPARPEPGLRGQERVRAQGRDARRGRQRRPETFEHIDPAAVGNAREVLVSRALRQGHGDRPRRRRPGRRRRPRGWSSA